jgi:hypothetical protein
MKHPPETILALFAGGELGLWDRWRVRRHLAVCSSCRRELKNMESVRCWLREASAELPPGFNWNQLAAEMRANIHLGLAAGECIEVRDHRRLIHRLRWGLSLVPAAVVLLLGWWLLPIRTERETASVVLEATSKGIELRQGGAALRLQHPGAGDVSYTVNTQGTLRARYVDSETGQVTISNVYAQ